MSATSKFPLLIDGDWSSLCSNEWELLTGVLLDARTPVERLRMVLECLKAWKVLDFRTLNSYSLPRVRELLKRAGYPWWRQKAYCFHQQDPTFDLKTATLEQIQTIYGIGPKLGNLWMRFMNPTKQDDFCVIDTHVRRWLRNYYGINDAKMTYEQLTRLVRASAAEHKMSVSDFDAFIVEKGISARQARRRK